MSMASGFVIGGIHYSHPLLPTGDWFQDPHLQILKSTDSHVPYIKWRKTVSSPYPVLVELAEVKKQAAVEKAILEAGGKHVKAILALIDM